MACVLCWCMQALEKIRLLPELKPAKTLVVADPKVRDRQTQREIELSRVMWVAWCS